MQINSSRIPNLIKIYIKSLSLVIVFIALSSASWVNARTRTFCSGSFECGIPLLKDPTISWTGGSYPCGGDQEIVCASGAPCDSGMGPLDNTLTSNLPFTIVCPTIDPSPPCTSPSTYNIPNSTVSTVCYECGNDEGDGTSRLGCNLPQKCKTGLEHITPASTGLDGPITNCPSYLPPDPPDINYPEQNKTVTYNLPSPIPDLEFPYTIPAINQSMPSAATIVNTQGICTDGLPEDFSGMSRHAWPIVEPFSELPGTVFVIHGRGSSCTGGRNRLLDSAGLYERNHLTYCVEYAQEDNLDLDDPPSINTVRVLPVLQDETGDGSVSCVAQDNCSFDRNSPLFTKEAATLSVPAIADVLAEAIKTIPTVGEITLVPHSQGGFIARALINQHYDDLRWSGKKIARMVSLAHPYFAKDQDPQKYVPWLCSGPSEGNLDCAVGRWLRGWDDWLASGGEQIDNTDFSQIHWVAVAGDGFGADGVTPGGITIESLDGVDCSEIFGGINGTTVEGDTSVPIQSSLGIDEFGFYPISQLEFDSSSQERCTHNAPCLFEERLARAPGDLPQASPRSTGFGALDFDGADDMLVIVNPADLAQLEISGSMTLEAWIKVDEKGRGYIVSKQGEYQLFLSASGILHWAIRNTSPGWASQNTGYVPPKHQWTHVAFVYDQSVGQAQTYANGVLVHSRTASGPVGDFDPLNDEFRIGHRQLGGAHFKGLIDEVAVWGRALSQDEITDRLESETPALMTGLLGLWKFDESEGNSVADASGNGLTIVLDEAGIDATPLRRNGIRKDGRLGGAVYFDGINDHVAITNSIALPELEVDDMLTLEAWVYPRESAAVPPGSGSIVSKEGEYQLTRLANGNIAFTLATASPGWSTRSTSVNLPAFQWSHVALVFDGQDQEARVFMNGTLVFTEAATGPIGDFSGHTTQDELWFGGRQAFATTRYFGVIDEVRVWNVARSQTDIETSMNIPLIGTETGLVGYWRFDELESGTVFDYTAGNNHGALGRAENDARPQPALATLLPGYPASLISDIDHDGLNDSDETVLLGTDPLKEDSDGDGLTDAEEVRGGGDPNVDECEADMDADGDVDGLDTEKIASNFVLIICNGNCPNDLNGDGVVDGSDLQVLANDLGRTNCPPD